MRFFLSRISSPSSRVVAEPEPRRAQTTGDGRHRGGRVPPARSSFWPAAIGGGLVLLALILLPDSSGGEVTFTRAFAASEDTYVKSTRPGGNFGQEPTLQADTQPSIKRVLLRFPVAGLPRTATLRSAVLKLWVADRSSQAGTIYRVNGSWTESAANWTNAPALGTEVARLAGGATAGTWKEVDVTTAVRGNGSVNFYLLAGSTDGVDYSSSEASQRPPTLVVRWSVPMSEPQAPSNPNPQPTPGPTPAPTPAPTPIAGTGVTYYVDNAAGNDANSGTSPATAWRTLNKASTAPLNPGDSLLFKRGGVWSGTLTMSRAGTAEKPILVAAFGSGALPVIQAGGCVVVSGTRIIVSQLQVSNCTWGGIRLPSGSRFNRIDGNVIAGNVAGVQVSAGASDNQVVGNTIRDNTKMSVLTPGGGDDSGAFGVLLNGDRTEVAYNSISGHDAFSYDYGRDGAAVEVYGGQQNHIHHNLGTDNRTFSELGNSRSRDNTFAYNLVRSSLADSIFLVTRGSGTSYGPVANTKLINNTVVMTGSGTQGFVCHAGCKAGILTMRNNIIQAVAKAGYADAPFDEDYNIYSGGQVQFSTGPHTMVTNPMFVNAGAGDLHVAANSPAVDSGVNAGYGLDFDGVQVPRDGNNDGVVTPDRGVFEKVSSPPIVTPVPTPAPTAASAPIPAPAPISPTGGPVTATAATDPVPNGGDAADDPAIWVNSSNPALSTIIGTNKLGGLAVYDLSGKQLHYYGGIKPNNVDVRYGFSLAGSQVDIVTASETDSDTILIYRIDPGSRALVDVRAGSRSTGMGVAGLCMYKSSASGKFYVFVSDSSGTVKQFELFATGGVIDYGLVRTLSFSSVTEGCVADDHHQTLYVSQEGVALWRLSAEPGSGSGQTQVAAVDGSILTADLEGLAMYDKGGGAGYLFASSQGSDDFAVFDRQSGAYRGRFQVVEGTIDGVTHTDGIEVTSASLGPAYPGGLFVAQDDSNGGSNQNFKLVSWTAVAGALGL